MKAWEQKGNWKPQASGDLAVSVEGFQYFNKHGCASPCLVNVSPEFSRFENGFLSLGPFFR